jgi:hypothetical protein
LLYLQRTNEPPPPHKDISILKLYSRGSFVFNELYKTS